MIEIIGSLGAVALGILGLFYARIYWKLEKNEKTIRAKQDEIDAVEPDITSRVRGHLVNESQRVAMVEVARKPLLRELERLKEERQFLLDKAPFFKR